MPANLTPQYSKAEEEYKRATTPAERLDKLREMFRLLPKHKGTEKIQAELKRKISLARDEVEGAKSSGKKAGPAHKIPRDGAGQIVLVGPPNAGKSALLAALTNAKPEIAPYPFTTRTPIPGMMAFEDVRVQLIDLPPITADAMEPWVANFLRGADAALFVLSMADDDVLDAAAAVLDRVAGVHVSLDAELPHDDDDETLIHLPARLVANAIDAPGAEDRLELAREWNGGRLPILEVSALSGAGLDELRRAAYDLLDVIRVHTKAPGKPVDRTDPFTLPRGATVLDLARAVHRDFENSLKFAKVWGASAAFEGQTVKRDHELADRDVVELHV